MDDNENWMQIRYETEQLLKRVQTPERWVIAQVQAPLAVARDHATGVTRDLAERLVLSVLDDESEYVIVAVPERRSPQHSRPRCSLSKGT